MCTGNMIRKEKSTKFKAYVAVESVSIHKEHLKAESGIIIMRKFIWNSQKALN